ncbi:MAG: hypothetical protein POH28_16910 [Acidocella sp.]|nr:hypothetical protein [Acidocella sp.]
MDRPPGRNGALRGMTTQLNKIYAIKTIALVAQEIGEDEDWLNEIIEEMELEDGLIWVYGPDGEAAAAFSDFGVENLEGIIRERRNLEK